MYESLIRRMCGVLTQLHFVFYEKDVQKGGKRKGSVERIEYEIYRIFKILSVITLDGFFFTQEKNFCFYFS